MDQPKKRGRPKGLMHERIRQRHLAESKGETPLQFMLRVMRDENEAIDVRGDMAKAAAPYIHSKMPTAIIMAEKQRKAMTETDEAILAAYAQGMNETEQS